MVLKAQIDKDLITRLPNIPSGVLLGTQTPLRILSHYATPPAPTKVSAPRWTATYAEQINAMCVGGISVVGIYSPNSAASSPMEISAARLAGLKILVCIGAKGRVVGKEVKEEGTWSMDLKNWGGMNELIAVEMRVCIEVWVDAIEEVEEGVVERLKTAVMMLGDGRVVVDEGDQEQLVTVMAWEEGEGKEVKGEILLPVDEKRRGQLCVKGSLHAEAIVTRGDTVGKVLSVVREDFERSVRTRMQLLREEQEEEEIAVEGDMEGKIVPVRVIARAEGRLPMSEYLMEGEKLEDDVQSRFVEVLSWTDDEIEQYALTQVEQFAHLIAVPKDLPVTKKVGDVEPLDIDQVDHDIYVSETLIPNAIGFVVLIAFLAILYKNLFT